MKPKSLALTLAGGALLAAAAFFPLESSGQATAEETQVEQALAEITAQQTILTETQAKIDEKIALVAEEIRVARIFAGRAGKK